MITYLTDMTDIELNDLLAVRGRKPNTGNTFVYNPATKGNDFGAYELFHIEAGCGFAAISAIDLGRISSALDYLKTYIQRTIILTRLVDDDKNERKAG